MEPTIRQLRYCVALAEHLHFGRAAESVGIAQPPLSVQIQELERAVGVALFDRSGRTVRVTPAGAAFVVRAREILSSLNAAMVEATEVAAGEQGRFRIAYPSSLLYTRLSTIISKLRKSRPRVAVDLIESPSSRHAELIRSGAADAGFARDAVEQAGIVRHRLLRESLLVAMPAAHRLAPRLRIDPRDLADEPFVFFPRDAHPVLHDRIIAVLNGAGVTPRIVQESNEWLTVVALVEAGMGLTVVPESFRSIRPSHLRYRPLRSRAGSEVCLCVSEQRESQLVEHFVRLAIAESHGGRKTPS